jgi:hypothetical protein
MHDEELAELHAVVLERCETSEEGSALGSIWRIATKRDPGQPWVPTTEVGREAGYARVLRVRGLYGEVGTGLLPPGSNTYSFELATSVGT